MRGAVEDHVVHARPAFGARFWSLESGFSIQEHLLRRHVKRFWGELAFKAHRLWYHSILGSRVIIEKRISRLNKDKARREENRVKLKQDINRVGLRPAPT